MLRYLGEGLKLKRYPILKPSCIKYDLSPTNRAFSTIISSENTGKTIEINGWLERVRNIGGVLFATIRNSNGIVQSADNKNFNILEKLREESVLKVVGELKERPFDMQNISRTNGKFEVIANQIQVLSHVDFNELDGRLPVSIFSTINHLEPTQIGETEAKLKYRYLVMRNASFQQTLKIRSSMIQKARELLINSHDFTEIETPILFKSTPEGANEFKVVFDETSDKRYALPQSPQQFKQLLMVGGIQKYFQIAKCFRNESNRADRQPEFTQLDLEMSFTSKKQIISLMEEIMMKMFQAARSSATIFAEKFSIPESESETKLWQLKNVPSKLLQEVKPPFEVKTYDEVMMKFGSDKPDLRIDLEIQDVSELFNGVDVFSIKLDGSKLDESDVSNKSLKKLCTYLRSENGSSVSILKVLSGKIYFEDSNNVFDELKVNSDIMIQKLKQTLQANENDIIVLASSKIKFNPNQTLSLLREKFKVNFLDSSEELKFCWITDFPLFEVSASTKTLKSVHHPFTRVHRDDETKFKQMIHSNDELNVGEIAKLRSEAFDLTCNGVEIGGGSMRIHDAEEQRLVFEKVLGHDRAFVDETFKHYFTAFSFGAPPHGGMAIGLDRLMCLMCDTKNIADVIAFPKNSRGEDPLTGAPS